MTPELPATRNECGGEGVESPQARHHTCRRPHPFTSSSFTLFTSSPRRLSLHLTFITPLSGLFFSSPSPTLPTLFTPPQPLLPSHFISTPSHSLPRVHNLFADVVFLVCKVPPLTPLISLVSLPFNPPLRHHHHHFTLIRSLPFFSNFFLFVRGPARVKLYRGNDKWKKNTITLNE